MNRRSVRRRPAAPGTRGFTLIEVLIALTLMGLVLTIAYAAFRLAYDGWDRTEAKVDRASEVQVGLAFVQRSLAAAFPLRRQKDPSRRIAFAGEGERVRLVARMPASADFGGLREIELAVVPSGVPDRKSVVLRHRAVDYDALDFTDFPDDGQVVVVSGLRAASFEYYTAPDPAKSASSGTWEPAWNDPNRLPDLVRLKVETADEAPWPEVVAQPLLRGGGCLVWDAFLQRCVR